MIISPLDLTPRQQMEQGSYFTPPHLVEAAHAAMSRVLGEDWRSRPVWDPAAGTGNLTRDHDWDCLISSTLEAEEVKHLGPRAFQHDFLNPPISEGSPFFSPEGLPNQVPGWVMEIVESAPNMVYFMNPPFGSFKSGLGKKDKNVKTRVYGAMRRAGMAKGSLYLPFQFLWRINKLSRGCKHTIGFFCRPGFLSSYSTNKFRQWFFSRYEYQEGFVFPGREFPGIALDWPCSFTIWTSGRQPPGPVQIPSLDGRPENTLTFLSANSLRRMSPWIREGGCRVKYGKGPSPPAMTSGLKVSGSPGTGTVCLTGCVNQHSQSVQQLHLINSNYDLNRVEAANDAGMPLLAAKIEGSHSEQPRLVSLPSNTYFRGVSPGNWWKIIAAFTARKLHPLRWQTWQDEFLVPDTSLEGWDRWLADAHIYSILHPANNCSSLRDIQHEGHVWQIRNHFFWLDPGEVTGTWLEPDLQKVNGLPHMAKTKVCNLRLGPTGQCLLDMITELWQDSLASREEYARAHPELHLGSWDAGVYQLRRFWEPEYRARWEEIKAWFSRLGEELRPGVYRFGFVNLCQRGFDFSKVEPDFSALAAGIASGDEPSPSEQVDSGLRDADLPA